MPHENNVLKIEGSTNVCYICCIATERSVLLIIVSRPIRTATADIIKNNYFIIILKSWCNGVPYLLITGQSMGKKHGFASGTPYLYIKALYNIVCYIIIHNG